MVKVKKSTENDFNWRVNISQTIPGKTYKFWGIIWCDLNNSLLEFGILNTFGSEMIKVRKPIKNDFNWRVNISRTTTVKTSKFCVMVCFDFMYDLSSEVQFSCCLRMCTLDLIQQRRKSSFSLISWEKLILERSNFQGNKILS